MQVSDDTRISVRCETDLCPQHAFVLQQYLQAFLRAGYQFIDLRLHLVCEVGFVPPDCRLVNEKEYLLAPQP